MNVKKMMGASMALAWALSGCFGQGALRSASSGFTGCPADEIEITNDEPGYNQRSWDATCRGRTFHCSGVAKTGMSCVEDRPAAASASPVASAATTTSAASPPLPEARTWQRYRIPDCGIAFLLPGSPKHGHATVRTKAGPSRIVSADVEMKDKAVVSVVCGSIPGAEPVDVPVALDGARDRALENAGATFESEEDVHAGDLVGRDVRFSVGHGRGRARMFVSARERRVITLLALPSTSLSNEEAKAFFEGLVVVAPGAKKAGQSDDGVVR